MRSPTLIAAGLVAAALACGAAAAQSSRSHRITDASLNSGGLDAGAPAASASVGVDRAAIGEAAVAAGALAGARFRVEGGFVAAYPPPGEVKNLRVTPGGLAWDPDFAAGTYQVYRGPAGAWSGTCLSGPMEAQGFIDPASPAAGAAFQYLVTVRNRIAEEGTLGRDSDRIERALSAPCP